MEVLEEAMNAIRDPARDRSGDKAKKRAAGTSKYDFVKVKVWLGANRDHCYVLSRFLVSRMLTVTKIPYVKAVKIALELKKALVDAGRLEVSQQELEAELFRLMAARGFGGAHVACYRMVAAFYQRRQPLVVLICGAPWTGKSAVAQQLAARVNIPNVMQTDVLCALLRAAGSPLLARRPLWARDDLCVDGGGNGGGDGAAAAAKGLDAALLAEFRRECRVARRAMQGDLVKTLSDGKPLIVEGLHLDPALFIPEFARVGVVMLPSRSNSGGDGDDGDGGGAAAAGDDGCAGGGGGGGSGLGQGGGGRAARPYVRASSAPSIRPPPAEAGAEPLPWEQRQQQEQQQQQEQRQQQQYIARDEEPSTVTSTNSTEANGRSSSSNAAATSEATAVAGLAERLAAAATLQPSTSAPAAAAAAAAPAPPPTPQQRPVSAGAPAARGLGLPPPSPVQPQPHLSQQPQHHHRARAAVAAAIAAGGGVLSPVSASSPGISREGSTTEVVSVQPSECSAALSPERSLSSLGLGDAGGGGAVDGGSGSGRPAPAGALQDRPAAAPQQQQVQQQAQQQHQHRPPFIEAHDPRPRPYEPLPLTGPVPSRPLRPPSGGSGAAAGSSGAAPPAASAAAAGKDGLPSLDGVADPEGGAPLFVPIVVCMDYEDHLLAAEDALERGGGGGGGAAAAEFPDGSGGGDMAGGGAEAAVAAWALPGADASAAAAGATPTPPPPPPLHEALRRARVLQRYLTAFEAQGLPVVRVRYGEDAVDRIHDYVLQCIQVAMAL